MEDQLGEYTDGGFQNAKRIYQEGGHSQSYAVLTLGTGLSSAVAPGDKVTGGVDATNGQPIVGQAWAEEGSGSTMLRVQYPTTDVQATWSNCVVGGLVGTVTDGCYAATGNVTVGGQTYSYTYNIASDNDNGRTLQGFSTKAETKMRVNGVGPYYKSFQKFVDYYGRVDYADAFVQAALDGTAVSLNDKTFDFSSYTFTGRAGMLLVSSCCLDQRSILPTKS